MSNRRKPYVLMISGITAFLVCLVLFPFLLKHFNAPTPPESIIIPTSIIPTPTPITPTTPSNSPSTISIIEEAIKNLKPGQVAFNTPTQMRVSNADIIELRVSNDLQRNIKEGLKGKVQAEVIKTSSFMQARLDGTNFDVKALTEKNRVITEKSVQTWRWSVTPTESGEQTLYLTLYARIKVPGQPEEFVDLKTFERSIKVDVNPGNWFSKNWNLILENWIAMTAIFAAISVFIAAKWQWIKGLVKKSKP